jgi:hypothetical protein
VNLLQAFEEPQVSRRQPQLMMVVSSETLAKEQMPRQMAMPQMVAQTQVRYEEDEPQRSR